jgi:hypothetical protein
LTRYPELDSAVRRPTRGGPALDDRTERPPSSITRAWRAGGRDLRDESTLHEAQAPPAPVIPLPTATRTKRVNPSTVRVGRARRRRHERAARAKSLPTGEKTMVG